MMFPSAPIEFDHNRACSRLIGWPRTLGPRLLQELDEVRVESVAPTHPVVPVAVDHQTDVVALRCECVVNRLVVGEILLDGAAGHRDGNRIHPFVGREHAAHEPRDATEAWEAPLVLVEALAEEAPRLQKERSEARGVRSVGVKHRQPSEARAHSDAEPAPPGRGSVTAQPRNYFVREHTAVEGGGRVDLVAIDRRAIGPGLANSPSNQDGRRYSGHSTTDLSPKGPGARSRLLGSGVNRGDPPSTTSSSRYSMRSTSGLGQASSHDFRSVVRVNAG